MVPLGSEARKKSNSMGKIIYETEKFVKSPETNPIKIILNKNYEFK